MNVINLLYDNPDGTQKFWRGTYDSTRQKLVLEYGRVGKSPRLYEVPPAAFTRSTAPEELLERAEKKRKSGYYDAANSQKVTASRPSTKPTTKQPTPDPKRSELMVALEQGAEGPSWFF